MAKRLDIVEQNFWDTIKQNELIKQGDKIVVGVSGGPDSITLLNCLYKFKEELQCKIIVAHINHLIREDSTTDEQYVENLCKELGIKFYKKRIEIEELAKKEKTSTEEMGRIVRYEFFDEILEKEKANKIAIAHNMNDNAETILLNLIRGTGLTGLEGIQPAKYKKYIRPLINCERKDIEDYCQKNNLKPRIDSTNSKNIYTRNKIRNIIIPSLKEINPNIIETLSKTSKIIAENNEYIKEQTAIKYKELAKEKDDTVTFELNKFNNISKNIRKELLLKSINNITGNTKNIDKANIDKAIELAENKIGNKQIQINKKIKVKINNGEIIIGKNF